MNNLRNRKAQCGFSLVEALVALLVLSVGLLAVAATQTKSLQFAQSSYQRAVAVNQANDLAERLWANACNLPASHFCDSGGLCAAWRQDHQDTPAMVGWSGDLVLAETGPPRRYRITVSWTDPRLGDDTFEYLVAVPELRCP